MGNWKAASFSSAPAFLFPFATGQLTGFPVETATATGSPKYLYPCNEFNEVQLKAARRPFPDVPFGFCSSRLLHGDGVRGIRMEPVPEFFFLPSYSKLTPPPPRLVCCCGLCFWSRSARRAGRGFTCVYRVLPSCHYFFLHRTLSNCSVSISYCRFIEVSLSWRVSLCCFYLICGRKGNSTANLLFFGAKEVIHWLGFPFLLRLVQSASIDGDQTVTSPRLGAGIKGNQALTWSSFFSTILFSCR